MSGNSSNSHRFHVHCNYCCDLLKSPDGVMTSCKHFFCQLCSKRLSGSCLTCGQRCRSVLLKNLPSSVRGLLVTDSFRQLALTAQAVQFQFGQNMLCLSMGSRRLAAIRRQQDALKKRTAQLTAAVAKLEAENASLRRSHEAGGGGGGDTSSVLWNTGATKPPSRQSQDQFGGLFGMARDASVTSVTRELFAETRPPTNGTSFTSLMGNMGM